MVRCKLGGSEFTAGAVLLITAIKPEKSPACFVKAGLEDFFCNKG
jgi:hypothetical protein